MEIISLAIGSVGLTFGIIALGQTAVLKKEVNGLKDDLENLRT